MKPFSTEYGDRKFTTIVRLVLVLVQRLGLVLVLGLGLVQGLGLLGLWLGLGLWLVVLKKPRKALKLAESKVYYSRQQHSRSKLVDIVATTLTSLLPLNISSEDRDGMTSIMCETCDDAYKAGGDQEFGLTLAKETGGMLWLIVYYHIKALIPEDSLLGGLFSLSGIRRK